MEANDPFTIQTSTADFPDANNFADPSMISLNPDESNSSRLLTQKLSIITDTYSLDSADYGSPLISADLESASPSVSHDGSKKQQSYSSYLTGRAQEVEKRRKLIQRLEKARDKGILVCSTPQISELTLTQLSMVLRRALKSSPGLREFVSDEILQYVFEDGTQQTPLTTESDRIPHFPDLPNEPDCITDNEEEQSESDLDLETKAELPLKESCQPKFYGVRRNLLAADRFASSIVWKLIEKQNKLKNFNNYEEFRHQEPPTTSDTEDNLLTCVRCRPLINRPKRKIFSVKTGEGQILRSNSPPPALIVNGQSDTDFDFEHKDLPAINVADKITVEHVMQSYLYRLGSMPPHFAIKHHAAFPEIGKYKDFYGFPKAIQSELNNFPTQLKPIQSSSGLGQKRRHDSIEGVDEEPEDDVNYPLLHKMKNEMINQQFNQQFNQHSNQYFPLKSPPKLLKSKSLLPIISPRIVEERVAPLKIKRNSIQVSSFANENDDLGRFINPIYRSKSHVSSTIEEQISTTPIQVEQDIDEPPQIEPIQQPSNPRSSSSSSSSSSDDSSSSDSETEDVILPLKGVSDDELPINVVNPDNNKLDEAGPSAANNPMAPQLNNETLDSGNESDNESSSTTTESANEEEPIDNVDSIDNVDNVYNLNNEDDIDNMDVEK